MFLLIISFSIVQCGPQGSGQHTTDSTTTVDYTQLKDTNLVPRVSISDTALIETDHLPGADSLGNNSDTAKEN